MSAIAEKIRSRQRLKNWWLPLIVVDPFRRCPHERQWGIYGDAIIAAGWKRARCLDCGRLLAALPRTDQVWPAAVSHLDETDEGTQQ